MAYQQTKEYFNSLSKFGIKPGLEQIRELLEHMGNPQHALKVIHVAGTNGKGSTTQFLYNILLEADYTVGVFNTPYIFELNEIIKYNGKHISDVALESIVSFVEDKAKKMEVHPTKFEVMTAVALEFFKRKRLDVVILEAGMGGKLDSTNIVKPMVSVITKIGLDHKAYLGESISEIAEHKAGIIKTETPTIVLNQSKEALKVIRETCDRQKAPLKVVQDKYMLLDCSMEQIRYRYNGQEYLLSTGAMYQISNSILALNVIQLLKKHFDFKVSDKAAYLGLQKKCLENRFEVFSTDPYIILDGAHNEAAASVLDASLTAHSDLKKMAVIGILEDKEYQKILKATLHNFELIIATEPKNPRKLSAERLQQEIHRIAPTQKILVKRQLEKIPECIMTYKDDYDMIVIFGSLYLVGVVREAIKDAMQ